jgi:hypothetical protein
MDPQHPHQQGGVLNLGILGSPFGVPGDDQLSLALQLVAERLHVPDLGRGGLEVTGAVELAFPFGRAGIVGDRHDAAQLYSWNRPTTIEEDTTADTRTDLQAAILMTLSLLSGG